MATVLTPPRPAPTRVRGTGVLPAVVAPPVTAPHPGRDVFIDAVRALATVAVVSVHWLMADASFTEGTLRIGNALSHGWAWVATWPLQALPLLFFAAGASAGYQQGRLATQRAHGDESAAGPRPHAARDWAAVVGARVRGIARPVGAFVAAWVVVLGVLFASPLPDQPVVRLARLAPQLLWFLAIWVVLVALTPVLRAAWRRWRWAALAVAVVAPVAVDLLRFGADVTTAAWVNVLLVWAVPFLLGIAYADDAGSRRRVAVNALPRPLLAAAAVGAVAAMVALVVVGPYPASMIGMPGAAISNLSPPTVPIVAQSIAQVAVVLLARGVIVRWARGRGRGVVASLARRSMTVYLWHLTAMFIVVGGVLVVLGEELPEPWSTDWWSTRPVWWGAFALVLLGLVRVFGRFDVARDGQRRRSGAPVPDMPVPDMPASDMP